MTQNMDKYKDLFIEESKERLEELDNQILTLEKNPSDKEIINGMFRTAHTFKGMAATMAYNDMAHMTHLMENLMTIIKSGNHTPDEEIISLLFECRDVLESSIEAIENGEENQIDYSAVQEHLDSYISKLNEKDQENRSKSLSPKTELPAKTNNESEEGNHNVEKNDQGKTSSASENLSAKVEKANDSENIDLMEQYKEEMQLSSSEKAKIDSEIDKNNSLYIVKIKLFDRTEMRYARAYLCIKKIKDFGELIKTIPGDKLIKEEAFGTQFSVVVIIPNHKKIKYLEQDIESIAAVEKHEIIKIKSVSSKDVIQTNDKKMKLSKDKDFSIQNVKVSINHLDDLMNMTGELLITKIRLDNIAQHNNITELDEVLTRINRITFDLQDKVLQMRMIPVSHIFDRFPRMVRDLAKKIGKMIDFSMDGRDIELDRTIIDQIGDPIVHLLRNSIDHGIEDPKEREAKKKNKIASLKLRAYRDKNFVVIEVSDDGRGIDYEKVKQKALSSHLIRSDDAQKMTENDLKNLLLGGGISTATKVSEISGRGVGLGVVKQKIENLGGIIEIDSKINEGSTFRLKLPLTVAIIKALLVSLGSKVSREIYAIPINSIARTIVIDKKEIRTIKNKEVITILGKIVSLTHLRKKVEFTNKVDEDSKINDSTMKTIVVIERSGMEVGLLVDNLIGQQEIVIKNLGGLLKGVRGISGGAILGDGKVALIIDVGALFG